MPVRNLEDLLRDLCGAIADSPPPVDLRFVPDPSEPNLFVAAVHAERRNTLGLDLLPRFANVVCGTESTASGDVRCPFFPPAGGAARSVLWVHDETDGWEETDSARARDLLRRATWIARALADEHLNRATFSDGPPVGPAVPLPGSPVEAALSDALAAPDLASDVPDALFWLWWAYLVGTRDQLDGVRGVIAGSPVRLVRDAVALVEQLGDGEVTGGIDLRAVRARIRDEVEVYRAGPDARRRHAAEELRRSVDERLSFEARGRTIRLVRLEPDAIPDAGDGARTAADGSRVTIRGDVLSRAADAPPSPMVPVELPGAGAPEAMALAPDGQRALVAVAGDAVYEGDLAAGTWRALHPNPAGHRVRQLAYLGDSRVAMVHTSSALYREQLGQTIYVRAHGGLRAESGAGVATDDPIGRFLAEQQLVPLDGSGVVRWTPCDPGAAYFPFNGHLLVARVEGGRLCNVAGFQFDCAAVERVGDQVVALATDGSAYRVSGLDEVGSVPLLPAPELGAEQRIPRGAGPSDIPPSSQARWRIAVKGGTYRIEGDGDSTPGGFEAPFDARGLGIPEPTPDDLRLCPSADGGTLFVLHRRDTAIHALRLADGRWQELHRWDPILGWAVDVAELDGDLVLLSSRRLALVRNGPRKRTLLWEYPLHEASALALLPDRRLAAVLALGESPMRPALIPFYLRELKRPAKTDNGGGPWATWFVDGDCLGITVRAGRLYAEGSEETFEVDPGALDRPPDWMVSRKWVVPG